VTDEPRPGTPVDEIDTPALLIDLDALQENALRMAGFFAARPSSLRPHAKTHKCPQIARRQLELGASGITCAKLGEAEIMADAGIRDLLIANQIVGSLKIDRLTKLAARCDLMVAVDNATNVAELSRVCQEKQVALRVLVEVDIGMGRCGVQPGKPVQELARKVVDAPGLHFAGLQAYEGHLVLQKDPGKRAAGIREAAGLLEQSCDLLLKDGIPVPLVSGGGTGTYDLTADTPPWNEIQAGSYILMDATYHQVRPEFRLALHVLATVISRPVPERIVTDAGMKVMTHEFGLPQPVEPSGLTLTSLSEEHGKLAVQDPAQLSPRPGDKIRFLPTHGCTTVNLHDRFYVIQDGALVDIWPIAARGRAQ
jgi:D-serine deaminase-like pyridoxal phosphate-dependent protein